MWELKIWRVVVVYFSLIIISKEQTFDINLQYLCQNSFKNGIFNALILMPIYKSVDR